MILATLNFDGTTPDWNEKLKIVSKGFAITSFRILIIAAGKLYEPVVCLSLIGFHCAYTETEKSYVPESFLDSQLVSYKLVE